MLKNLYSIRDIKVDKFDSPFDSTNDETAKRFFTRLLNEIPLMNSHPEDFTLHATGTMDDTNGILMPHPTIQYITSGLDCIKTNQSEQPNETPTIGNETSVQPST